MLNKVGQHHDPSIKANAKVQNKILTQKYLEICSITNNTNLIVYHVEPLQVTCTCQNDNLKGRFRSGLDGASAIKSFCKIEGTVYQTW